MANHSNYQQKYGYDILMLNEIPSSYGLMAGICGFDYPGKFRNNT